jgi:predicted component of type VI protein secretion system
MGPDATKTFGIEGGRIGRAPDNDWVIPDRLISRHQGYIYFENDQFYLETPGNSVAVWVDGRKLSVPADEAYVLKHGDLLLFGQYVVQVTISNEMPSTTSEWASSDLMFSVDDVLSGSPLSEVVSAAMYELDNALDVLGPQPPVVVDEVAKRREKRAAEQQSPATASPQLAAQPPVPEEPSPEAVRAIMRIVVDGLIDLLRVRNQMKGQLRVPISTALNRESNPLMRAATAEGALHEVLVGRNTGSLPSPAAFQEAFDEIRSHQMAMLNAIRAGYAHMLAEFAPEVLKERFDKPPPPKGFFRRALEPKPLELYQQWFAEQSKNGQEWFRRLFGNEFARAYEQQSWVMINAQRTRRRKNHG